MNSETQIGPGIRVPPPVIYLAALLTGMGLNSLWAMAPLSGSWRYIVTMAGHESDRSTINQTGSGSVDD